MHLTTEQKNKRGKKLMDLKEKLQWEIQHSHQKVIDQADMKTM